MDREREDKKRAAAVAAVIRYMEEAAEQERRPANPWAKAGRLEQMHGNWMVQMRVVTARRFPGL